MAAEAVRTRLTYISAEGIAPANGGDVFPVENPATGEIIAEAYEATSDDLDAIVAQAELALQSSWRHTAPDARGQMLHAWADAIVACREELGELELTDVGHLRREALGDIDSCVDSVRYYAGMADKLEARSFQRVPGRLAYGVNEPFGVVGGINAYNANARMVAQKVAPALIAGNCIVLKAPEVAPLLTFRLVELALEAGIPPGVVNVLTGRGDVVGRLLTEHPGIGMVAFTGGPGAGRAVISQSARNIVPVFLELGGKSPAILLPDADLGVAIASVVHSNFVKSGQSCVAGSRILVHTSMYEQVCAEIATRAKAIRVGMPSDEASQMGTLISKSHRSHVDRLVRRALDSGATCIAGGAAAVDDDLAAGAFYQPTVLADVADDNPAATTEFFGPVASVMSYEDVDEALARANANQFGLSAQVWGNDAGAIQYLAENLTAGTVWINTYRASHTTVPFGGMKESGFGRENGFAGVEMFTRPKAVVWDLTTSRDLPYTD